MIGSSTRCDIKRDDASSRATSTQADACGLTGHRRRAQSEREVLDQVLAGVVEPMSVVDDQQLRRTTTHLFVGLGDAPTEVVGDVAPFWHDDGSIGRARLARLRQRANRPAWICRHPVVRR